MEYTALDIVMRNDDFVIYDNQKPILTPRGNEITHHNARLLRQAITQKMMGLTNPLSTIKLLSKLIDTKVDEFSSENYDIKNDILFTQEKNTNWIERIPLPKDNSKLIDFIFLNSSSLHSALNNLLLKNGENLAPTAFYQQCITELTCEQSLVLNTLISKHESGILLHYLFIKRFLSVTEYAAGIIILQFKSNNSKIINRIEQEGLQALAKVHQEIIDDGLIALDFLTLYQSQNHTSIIEELIQKGENNQIEYKSTLRWDLRQGKKSPAIEHAALKTICAFLNSEGGDLLIGVRDDGSIEGIESDRLDSDDRFLLHIWALIKSCMGQEVVEWIKTTIQKFGNKTVCRVHCLKGKKPIFLNQKGFDEAFYIRIGPSSSSLEISSAIKYIEQHFHTIK
jgi:hypothetical protein